MVCQLLKGILNSRPPQPRYPFTWDVSVAVEYIAGLGLNTSLSLKLLTQKLAMLLALTAAERSSELVAHDLCIRTGKNLKQSFHASFLEDKNLCVVECLKEYESRTRDMRSVLAHKLVSASMVARWVRSLPQTAGIDTGLNLNVIQFVGHRALLLPVVGSLCQIF